MAFAYIPMSPDDKKLLETIFTDEFMQWRRISKLLKRFQSSSAVFTNWKSDIMVYNEEVFDGFVRESTRFTSWDEMVRTAADRAFSIKKNRKPGPFRQGFYNKKVRFRNFGKLICWYKVVECGPFYCTQPSHSAEPVKKSHRTIHVLKGIISCGDFVIRSALGKT